MKFIAIAIIELEAALLFIMIKSLKHSAGFIFLNQ